MKRDFDAVIVGGSVAGCAAARLYAQRGARVALVERRPDLDAYKTVCTHYIQPSATPTLERLGLAGDLDARGAVRNSIDLSVVLIGPHRDRLPEFRRDAEGAYLRMLEALPDPPDMSRATRESKLLGKLDVPNVSRPAARPGLAFVGDAALASDPLWGVGCGWALQSAAWLVDETADALTGGGDVDVDAALESYRRVHRKRLAPHHFMLSDLASGRVANPLERKLYRAAVTDDDIFHAFEAIGSRRASPSTLFAPRTMWRLARAA